MLDKTSKLRKTVSIKRPISFRQYVDNRVSGRARIEKNNKQKKKYTAGRGHFSSLGMGLGPNGVHARPH